MLAAGMPERNNVQERAALAVVNEIPCSRQIQAPCSGVNRVFNLGADAALLHQCFKGSMQVMSNRTRCRRAVLRQPGGGGFDLALRSGLDASGQCQVSTVLFEPFQKLVGRNAVFQVGFLQRSFKFSLKRGRQAHGRFGLSGEHGHGRAVGKRCAIQHDLARDDCSCDNLHAGMLLPPRLAGGGCVSDNGVDVPVHT